ncbi:MAG: NifB/NifX family molybdenum-iron cluster-binding protein [Deltaproteobacteria bacterium]|nr:NifB/NifX family molybdenum-iron cluster-binding protein [Deltaproteobacteria bacterium]
MKLAVSSQGKNIESPVDPRFGRCAYFLIVETDDLRFEAVDNENRSLGGGAGIQSAQFVASKGAKAILTGFCGPNAVRTLSAAGIELYVVQRGTVKEAVEKYIKGELKPSEEANVADHFGLGRAGSRADTQTMGFGGRVMGMGRGMGLGRGGGRGRGMG